MPSGIYKHKSGKECPNYKQGKTLKSYYCINCDKEISISAGIYGQKRCRKCTNKEHSIKISGKNSGRYKDGRCSKTYYCKEPNCNNKIHYTNWLQGNKRCYSCAMKLKWQNDEYKDRVIKNLFKGLNLKPNKPEKLLNKILQTMFPKEYEFVGDGKIILDGLNPDFINCNGQKKIIELYGDYWHNLPQRKETDRRRIKIYRNYGYKTLIIWEHELKEISKLQDKLEEFHYDKSQK